MRHNDNQNWVGFTWSGKKCFKPEEALLSSLSVPDKHLVYYDSVGDEWVMRDISLKDALNTWKLNVLVVDSPGDLLRSDRPQKMKVTGIPMMYYTSLII